MFIALISLTSCFQLYLNITSDLSAFFMTDVYVKVSLLLQSKVMKTKKTEVIRRSVNPSFNESFTFKLAPDSLDAASITITAMQNNTAHVRGKSYIRDTSAHTPAHIQDSVGSLFFL